MLLLEPLHVARSRATRSWCRGSGIEPLVSPAKLDNPFPVDPVAQVNSGQEFFSVLPLHHPDKCSIVKVRADKVPAYGRRVDCPYPLCCQITVCARPALVPRVGLEPTCPKAAVLQTGAIANSASATYRGGLDRIRTCDNAGLQAALFGHSSTSPNPLLLYSTTSALCCQAPSLPIFEST